MKPSLSAAAIGLMAIVAFQQPAAEGPAMFIDSDSPVQNAADAGRIRAAALAGGSTDARFFQLTSRSVQAVPDRDRAVDSIPFEIRQHAYNGVTLTVSEASEILRKNESVRDAVINRVCGRVTGGCAGAVHAAAIALIQDTNADTSSKIRSLVETCRTHRLRTVVLMTAGWPYRDAGSVKLEDAARELRRLGTTMVVWRLPSSVAYGALVADASATLASRTSGTLTALRDERDAQRVGAPYVRTDSPTTPASGDRAGASPVKGSAVRTFDDAPDEVLRLASSYVARFESTFSAVVWREHYTQEDRAQLRFPASGLHVSQLMGRRRLDSELILLWLPQEASWIAVRDVMAVDGVQRPPAERQVRVALESSEVTLDSLKKLATENGRFNIGKIIRTFNEPTLALIFLDEHYRRRFSFRRTAQETTDGRHTATYEFVERSRPTVIRDRQNDVPAHGSVTIDGDTGEVLRTSLELNDSAGGLRGTMTVRYEPHEKFDVLVPMEMREEYVSTTGEHVSTVASYSDFRRFETAGRLIGVRDRNH
ncbi:MAG TPA: hypothetical protein VH458_24350 [Vicinamibacterales bacterium]